MHLPIKTHYAALAMLALAQVYDQGERLGARTIARQHGIPAQFLSQILQQLRNAGLIRSVRGAQGGFMLAKPPAEITLAEITDAIGSTGGDVGSLTEDDPLAAVIIDVWKELEASQRKLLESYTLAKLLDRAREGGSMFYI